MQHHSHWQRHHAVGGQCAGQHRRCRRHRSRQDPESADRSDGERRHGHGDLCRSESRRVSHGPRPPGCEQRHADHFGLRRRLGADPALYRRADHVAVP